MTLATKLPDDLLIKFTNDIACSTYKKASSKFVSPFSCAIQSHSAVDRVLNDEKTIIDLLSGKSILIIEQDYYVVDSERQKHWGQSDSQL